MFFEIKEYQMINLNEIAAFYIYLHSKSEYTRRTLFVRLHGSDESMRFDFETERETRSAYHRLIKAMIKFNIKVEEESNEEN